MSVRNVKITYNGEDLILSDCAIRERYKYILQDIPLDRFSYSATASQGGEGFFLCTRDTMEAIIEQVIYDQDESDGYKKGKADLVFASYNPTEELTFPNVYVGPKSRMICAGSGESIFLLHLVDQLWRSTRLSRTGQTDLYNMLMPDGVTVIAETNNGGANWTWATLVDDLFDSANLVTTTATLAVPATDPEADPRDFDFISVPGAKALDHVCAINGWVFAYDPFTTACTINDTLTPSPDIQTVVTGLASRLICGGLMNAEYNYQAWEGVDTQADSHKFLGSDLFSMPLPPNATVPGAVNVLFPVRFSDGRYPTAADGSADESIRLYAINYNATSAGPFINADFNNAIANTTKWIDGTARLSLRDFFIAIRAPTSPFAVQNASAVSARAIFLAKRVFAMLVLPRGTLIYDGFHQIVPSVVLHSVCVGVEDGIPFTRLDLERRPSSMFGADFEIETAGMGVMGIGNNNIHQRFDGSWALHGNSALFPFFDETDAGDLCN